MEEQKGYSISTTLKKGAYPIFIIAIVEAAAAALQSAGVSIDKAQLYAVAVGGYGVLIAFINRIKNRKKK